MENNSGKIIETARESGKLTREADNSSPNQGRLGGVLIPTPTLPNQGGSKRKCAFTLAEVLITLAIIGVVSVMTLPSVIQKQHEKATVVKVKKMYNVLSQAYLYAVKEYGLPDEWDMNNAKDMRNKLFLNIKKIKNCDVASKKDECGVAGHIIGWMAVKIQI